MGYWMVTMVSTTHKAGDQVPDPIWGMGRCVWVGEVHSSAKKGESL